MIAAILKSLESDRKRSTKSQHHYNKHKDDKYKNQTRHFNLLSAPAPALWMHFSYRY